MRGIKLDEFGPDLIIFDDIDNQDDTPKTVEKKVRAIATAILPAYSEERRLTASIGYLKI